VTGVGGPRHAGDAVLELWRGDSATAGERAAVRQELAQGAERVAGWYGEFATSLVDGHVVPQALPADEVANGRLVDAVSHDLRDEAGEATATAVRVLWTGDHLDAARRLQDMLVVPAREAVEQHALA